MEYKEVLKVNQISEGDLKTIGVSGHQVTIAQVDGQYYAFDDLCTHAECSLGDGFLEEKVIECPCHGSKFDVTSGAVLNLPAVVPLKTYPVKVGNGAIFVGIR